MSRAPAPIVLASLSSWKAEVLDQTVERVRLALAADHVDRAYRVLADYERRASESPPVESLLDDRAAAVLRRRGIVTLADLTAAADELDGWPEISTRLRRRVRAVLERLG